MHTSILDNISPGYYLMFNPAKTVSEYDSLYIYCIITVHMLYIYGTVSVKTVYRQCTDNPSLVLPKSLEKNWGLSFLFGAECWNVISIFCDFFHRKRQ